MIDGAAAKDAARRGAGAVLERLDIKGVSADELELIAEAVVGLVDVLGNSAVKRARAAAQAAADTIVTDKDAAEELSR